MALALQKMSVLNPHIIKMNSLMKFSNASIKSEREKKINK